MQPALADPAFGAQKRFNPINGEDYEFDGYPGDYDDGRQMSRFSFSRLWRAYRLRRARRRQKRRRRRRRRKMARQMGYPVGSSSSSDDDSIDIPRPQPKRYLPHKQASPLASLNNPSTYGQVVSPLPVASPLVTPLPTTTAGYDGGLPKLSLSMTPVSSELGYSSSSPQPAVMATSTTKPFSFPVHQVPQFVPSYSLLGSIEYRLNPYTGAYEPFNQSGFIPSHSPVSLPTPNALPSAFTSVQSFPSSPPISKQFPRILRAMTSSASTSPSPNILFPSASRPFNHQRFDRRPGEYRQSMPTDMWGSPRMSNRNTHTNLPSQWPANRSTQSYDVERWPANSTMPPYLNDGEMPTNSEEIQQRIVSQPLRIWKPMSPQSPPITLLIDIKLDSGDGEIVLSKQELSCNSEILKSTFVNDLIARILGPYNRSSERDMYQLVQENNVIMNGNRRVGNYPLTDGALLRLRRRKQAGTRRAGRVKSIKSVSIGPTMEEDNSSTTSYAMPSPDLRPLKKTDVIEGRKLLEKTSNGKHIANPNSSPKPDPPLWNNDIMY